MSLETNNADQKTLDSFWWDTAPAEERMVYSIQSQAVPAALFAKDTVPFYRDHYRHLSFSTIQRIATAEEFAEIIPPITKEHLARNHPHAFLPEGIERGKDRNRGEFFRFGTGGTTSKPVQVSHSITDWRAMAYLLRRSIEFDFLHDEHYAALRGRHAAPQAGQPSDHLRTPLAGARFIGSYSGDHITNAIFAPALQDLGAELHFRPSTTPTAVDLLDQAQAIRATGILAPPEGENVRKGLFLRDLMDADARAVGRDAWRLNTRLNPGFQFIIWSSMPISQELYDHLAQERQIPYIKGHYGSTETAGTSSTCSQRPREFHLDFGSTLVLVKRFAGAGLAEPDELGYTLVSKLAGVDTRGQVVPPTGTVIINFMTGDAARLTRDGERCACGRTTPVLYDTQRVEFTLGKALHGCQIG